MLRAGEVSHGKQQKKRCLEERVPVTCKTAKSPNSLLASFVMWEAVGVAHLALARICKAIGSTDRFFL